MKFTIMVDCESLDHLYPLLSALIVKFCSEFIVERLAQESAIHSLFLYILRCMISKWEFGENPDKACVLSRTRRKLKSNDGSIPE